MDREIYIKFNGEMHKVAEPTCSPHLANFVITFKGRDWSGYRTLTQCEKQFPEIVAKPSDDYAVVQR